MTKHANGPVARLRARVAELEQLSHELKDNYMRARADFENYRKRVQRDSELVCRSALEGIMLELLPTLDSFDRALAVSDDGASLESLRKGMELISRQLRETLARHGLEEFSCLGEEFDPRKAEAVNYEHAIDCAENTVLREQCRGFKCGDRVLRPAQVVVAKPKPDSPIEGDRPSRGARPADDGAASGPHPAAEGQ